MSNNPAVATTSPRKRFKPDLEWEERFIAPLLNIRFAKIAPQEPPANCATKYPSASTSEIRLKASSAKVTTGLKCAPLTGARIEISIPNAKTVESALIRSWSATSLVRLVAIIPEPTTTATSMPVPRSSAKYFLPCT